MFNKLNNPLEKVFLLNLYTRRFSFNLNDYLGNIRSANDETNIIGYFKELEKNNEKTTVKPFNIDIFNMSLYGENTGSDPFIIKDIKEDVVNSALIAAETFRKQGDFIKSLNIYESILKGKVNINKNQWFIANLGKAEVFRKNGKMNKAISQMDIIKENTKDKLFHAIIIQTKGKYESMTGNHTEAISLLSSSIRSFQNFQNPLFLSLSYIIRGIDYFIQNKYDLADKDWKNAKKNAKLASSKYAEAFVLINIADMEIKKGRYSSALKNIMNAQEIFKSKNDFDGQALVEFNFALYYIALGDKEKAIQHMKAAEIIAYPLPCPYERKVRRDAFAQRVEEADLDIDFTFIWD